MTVESDDRSPYVVESTESGWAVVSPAGVTVLVTSDGSSAEQYATLLSQAYRAGFKAGFREARRDR